MLGRLGRAPYMRGLNDQARKVLQEALELAETVGDAARMAAVYRDLGDVEFSSGTLPAAVDAYEKGRQIAESIGDQAGVAAAHTMLCNALARAGASTTQCDTARWRWNSANGSAMSDASPGQIFCWAIATQGFWDVAIQRRHISITAKRNAFSRELGLLRTRLGALD